MTQINQVVPSPYSSSQLFFLLTDNICVHGLKSCVLKETKKSFVSVFIVNNLGLCQRAVGKLGTEQVL